jgi:ferredoxin
VEPIINALIERMSDSNARIRDMSKKGMEMLSASPSVGPNVVGSHTLRPIPPKQKGAWRPLLNRITLLNDVVSAHGIGPSSVQMEPVMNFLKANSAFANSNGDVRDATRDLTASVAKYVGIDAVEPYLSELRKQQRDDYNNAFAKAGATGGSNGSAAAAPSAAIESPRAGAKAGGAASNSNVSPTAPGSNRKSSTDSKQSKAGAQPNTSPANRQRPPDLEHADHGGHATGQHGSPTARHTHIHPPSHGNENGGEGDDFSCNFCGAGDTTWNEDALDMHYLRDCPLLAPCPACAQVCPTKEILVSDGFILFCCNYFRCWRSPRCLIICSMSVITRVNTLPAM